MGRVCGGAPHRGRVAKPSTEEQAPPRQDDVVPAVVDEDREWVSAVAQDMLVRYAAVFERLKDS